MILDEYSDFANVFSKKKALVLLEQTELNEHAIELEGDKQLPYGQIYSLGPVELETLKAFIEIHLKTGFIWPSKSRRVLPSCLTKSQTATFVCMLIIKV